LKKTRETKSPNTCTCVQQTGEKGNQWKGGRVFVCLGRRQAWREGESTKLVGRRPKEFTQARGGQEGGGMTGGSQERLGGAGGKIRKSLYCATGALSERGVTKRERVPGEMPFVGKEHQEGSWGNRNSQCKKQDEERKKKTYCGSQEIAASLQQKLKKQKKKEIPGNALNRKESGKQGGKSLKGKGAAQSREERVTGSVRGVKGGRRRWGRCLGLIGSAKREKA